MQEALMKKGESDKMEQQECILIAEVEQVERVEVEADPASISPANREDRLVFSAKP
jgi:hypothetical protein